MSKKSKIDQINSAFRTFNAQDVSSVLTDNVPIAEWEGLTKEDLIADFESCRRLLDDLIGSELLQTFPFTQLTQVFNSLTACNQHAPNLISNPNQGHFQNFAAQLDSLKYHLNLANVDYLLAAGKDLTEIRGAYEEETTKLETARNEVESLKERVGSLIEPAVAGSLSQSFSTRRSSLFVSRVIWLIVWAIAGVAAIYFTHDLVRDLGANIPGNQAASTDGAAEHVSSGSFYFFLLRSATLVPIYLVFFFALNQYKKERNFEEEYAHKAAVAAALPSYGRLAEDDAVKDQIVTQASAVVFRSPVDRRSDGKDRAIDKAMDQVERIIKLTTKDDTE